ncbi:hypothetical protein GIB67_032079 [Kingdonia uniflora]|uniref:Beta-glucosidase n=1 Tax=Kingdonia uniflora TaxID=39325 RepID=A0A7J7MX81_9MAGN|nr:hypothetical protein GIB67_032079 [Kingdonia uniflora]
MVLTRSQKIRYATEERLAIKIAEVQEKFFGLFGYDVELPVKECQLEGLDARGKDGKTIQLFPSSSSSLLVVASAREYNNNDIIATTSTFSRNGFPPDFVFNAGSSAYQIEGAASENGRKQSIWDTFTHAEKVADKSNANIGSEQYHKYKDNVKLMQDMGLDAYRMSISWSRLIPDGREAVNPKGLNYYNNLINELITHRIQPQVILNHFDHPQVLEDEYNGLLSPKIIEDFTAYADICFKEFGDRVKSWSTFNEPNI